jgi:hypothetical protein
LSRKFFTVLVVVLLLLNATLLSQVFSQPGLVNFRWVGETGLALCGQPEDNTQWDTLRSWGVTATINLRSGLEDDVEYIESLGITYYYLPTVDWTLTNEETQGGVDWINQQLANGRKVLVHCGHGVNRAPTMACMWYVHEGHTPEEALNWIIQYPISEPSDNQTQAIYDYYNWLNIVEPQEDILEPDLIPFAHAGSTKLSDGTYLVLKLDWSNGLQVWKSVNLGETWTYVSTLPGAVPLGFEKMFCTDEDTILVANGYQGYQGYIWRSTDRGATWTTPYMFSSTDEGTPFNIYEDPSGNIYVPVYSSDPTIGHAKLLRSTNDGAFWQQIAFWPEYRHCHGMFVNKYNGYIYVSLGDGPVALMRSKDGGLTWTDLCSYILFTSVNGRGDSNLVYLGTDNWGETRIYRFADDGSSNFSPQIMYDYGNDQSGNIYFMQIANGKLVFGTSGSCSGLLSGYHVILGVSDADWESFSVVYEYIADGPWQGFDLCTLSYWNISKVFVSNGLAFTPSSDLSCSISPASATIALGRSQMFVSDVSGGVPSYSYQWFLNGTAVSGATGQTWTFVPSEVGVFEVYVNVGDSLGDNFQSNTAIVQVVMSMVVTISPSSVIMYVGQSQMFSSSVTNGNPPFSYQWYLNDTAVAGATSSTWIFTPAIAGWYEVYLNVTDVLDYEVQSNVVTDIVVYLQFTASISPPSVNMTVGMSQTFTSTVSGGAPPYTYQWYLNDTAVPDATGATWTFIPRTCGHYVIYLNVTDSLNFTVKSNVVDDVSVSAVYLILTAEPNQEYYLKGEMVTFTVNVLNSLNPALESNLSLTVTGVGNHSYFDVQPISVQASAVGEYTFDWTAPDVSGTYVVEVELVQPQLTAYDAVWLRVN